MDSQAISLQPRLLGALLVLLVLTACTANPVAIETSGEGAAPSSNAATSAFHALLDEAWQWELRASPEFASSLGDKRYQDRWQDLSLEAFAERQAWRRQLLQRLARIDATALGREDALNYELFRRTHEQRLQEHEFETWLMPVSHSGGVHTADQILRVLRFEQTEDYEHWLTRLGSLDRRIDQSIELMRLGLAKGMTPPRILLQRVPAQVAQQLVEDPRQSPLFQPFTAFPSSVGATERQALAARAERILGQQVIPAYARLDAFLRDVYLPNSRETIAAADLPRGREYYELRARTFTTTDMTPDEIHARGLAEVARIRAQMQEIIDELGYQGDFNDFIRYLRTDPRFYYDNPEDLLAAYRATAKKIDPELVKLFGTLPSIPYGVIPIPDALAPDTTTAYYSPPAADGSRAGYFYVNLYQPQSRPKYEIEVLTVHEAMPGHHLQIALAQQLPDMPDFRRFLGFTAFVEGWGLYSESLGEALGLYQDPYSKFGQLTYEMWRAIRLVVDTGMHYKGWSRARAIEFFQQNAAKTELDIVNEIDRYINWPGQALAYKIGELKIKDIRAKAERALGADFDVRAFHDALLGGGALPLDILEQRMDGWIAQQTGQ